MALFDILLWTIIAISIYFSIWWFIALNKTIVESKVFDRDSAVKYIEENIDEYPRVSVIVPLWNEEKTIVETLKSVLNLEYPKDKLELIIANDGSKDNSEKEIFNFIPELVESQEKNIELKTITGIIRKIKLRETKVGDVIIKYFYQINSGKGVALNVGITIAESKFYAGLDSDSFVDSTTLVKMIATLIYQSKTNSSIIAAITPAMMTTKPKTTVEYLQHYEYIMSMLASRIMGDHDMMYITPGPFSLYDIQIIKSLGGYHENQKEILTEDQELAYRIQNKSFLIRQCPNGYVYSKPPSTLRALIKQRNRWFKGSLICIGLYKHLILNKKYGDFGIQQMSINILRVFLAIAALYVSYELLLNPIIHIFKNMYLYGFDIMPFIQNWKLSIDPLLWNYPRLIGSLAILALGLTMLVISFINARKKLETKDFKYIVVFFFVYHIIMSFIMIKVIIELALGKKEWW